MWLVGYMDIFILSRFVSDAELGIYHLASRAALPRRLPARRLPQGAAAAAEDADVPGGRGRVRGGTARGIQFGYFTLMLIGALLVDHRSAPTPSCGSRPPPTPTRRR